MTSSAIQAQVHVYESEYRAIIAATRLFAQEETGGDLYGSFTHGGMPVIWLASGPGPRVRRNRTHFEQDTAFTTAWQRRLKDDFGVQFIGTWHSHHHLGLHEPSSGDREAARNYARNHNRQKTLEVIVTYERHDEITLWPYFYPNAQEELWVESAFVLLPGVSPIRQSLRNEEMVFSGGSDWRSVPSVSSSREQYTRRDSFNAASSSHEGASNEQIAIPLEIQGEVESIGDRILDINQTGSTFVISIQVGRNQTLDVYIDLSNLYIMRIDLVDAVRGNKRDISEIAHEERFPFSLRQRGVLKRLVSEFPRIQRRLERLAFSKAPVEHRIEDLATPMQRSEMPQAEPQRDAVESERIGIVEHNQPIAPQDTGSHTDNPAKDVIVLVTTHEQHAYRLSATISNETQCELFLHTLAEVPVYQKHIKFTPKEGTGDASIQDSVVLQEVSDVEMVLKQLFHTFPLMKLNYDAETKNALSQNLVASASIAQDAEGNKFIKFMKAALQFIGI